MTDKELEMEMMYIERGAAAVNERRMEESMADLHARAERAEALLAEALRFNAEGHRDAHAAEMDANAMASLLQDSDAMRRALRSRAEKAEKERDEEKAARERAYVVGWELVAEADEHKAARERAEKELEEARGEWTDTTILLGNERSARLRAEADNAALVEALRRVVATPEGRLHMATTAGLLDDVRAAMAGQHPGDALLEYVRALEAVREAVEPYRTALARILADSLDGDARALLDACARADELKRRMR
jgi:hypothetical protein